MRWVSFFIVVCIAAVLQTSVMPFLAVRGIRPELMVVVAVHYALAARSDDAPLACWCIGLLMDLASDEYATHANLGLHAFGLGAIGWLIVQVRSVTIRESVVTQLVFTFAAAFVLRTVVEGHFAWIVGRQGRGVLRLVMAPALYAAMYTAVIAPYGHWILRQFRTWLGLGPTHRLRVR